MQASEDELTKLAVESLLRDAKRFTRKRELEFRATQQRQVNNLNKSFLKNLLANHNSHNRRVDSKQGNINVAKQMQDSRRKNGESSMKKEIIEISDSESLDEFEGDVIKRQKVGPIKENQSWKLETYTIGSSSDSDLGSPQR